MLKSTYTKAEPAPPTSAPAEPALPPGWTAHKAPTGHTYYYHAETKKSTYTRPTAAPAPQPDVIPSYAAGQFAGGFAPGAVAAPGLRQLDAFPGPRGGRGGAGGRYRNEPQDRPKHRYEIPECRPWVLVKTKLGRRFVHNPETGESLWRFPEDVMKGVIEFDRVEREKRERRERGEADESEALSKAQDDQDERQKKELDEEDDDDEEEGSSEYTEVTDDEEEEDDAEQDGEGRSKRQRTDEPVQDGPIEFNEDDLAAELDDMDEYGFDDEFDEGEEEPLSEEDAQTLFFDLLEDFKLNPFSTWDKVIEDGAIIEDSRYTALPNMKARRMAWDTWSGQKIQQLKEAREKQAKRDPKIPYFAFLQDHATPKLYWPEFKRKYRKEPEMKATKVSDKDREKWYREYVKRVQLPQSSLKADFTSLIKSLPASVLNGDTSLDNLPPALLTDMKYISLAPTTRNPLLEAYIGTLPPAPTDGLTAEQEAELEAKRKEKRRRQQALADRERKIEAEKRRQQRDLQYGKGRMREEQMELERAMQVGRSGLKSQLENVKIDDTTEEKKS